MDKDDFSVSELNRVRRVAKRGVYDRQTIYQIIDATLIGHVGINDSQQQRVAVIPMFHARMDDAILLHGAQTSRLMENLASEEPVCVCFSLVDGIVLAKSLFHHSMNYRSAVVFGTGSELIEHSDRIAALKQLSDKIMPGRWDDARQPNEQELKATKVVKIEIESASAKIRTGGPVEEPEDEELTVWSGVLPLKTSAAVAQTDELSQGIDFPEYIQDFARRFNDRAN